MRPAPAHEKGPDQPGSARVGNGAVARAFGKEQPDGPAGGGPERDATAGGPKPSLLLKRPPQRRQVLAGTAADVPKGKLGARLAEAAEAYSSDRYHDALWLLRRVVALCPASAAVRELLGLTYYRLGRWKLALRELAAHRELSGSYDQYPVIADCYRALGRYEEAEAIWLELRRASPSAEVVAEGRLVAAGALADQGDIAGAVKLLEPSLRKPKPKLHDLRQWYMLAELYERAGDLPRAREVFARVYAADPDAYDVSERLAALG